MPSLPSSPRSIELGLISHAKKLKIEPRENEVNHLWCPIRRIWLSIQPEEIVRQSVIHFLMEEHNISRGRIGVEKGFKVNGRLKRFDVVVFDRDGLPLLLVECKAPEVPVNQTLFDQLSTYNRELRAKWLWATNGRVNYICQTNKKGRLSFSNSFPDFE